MSVARPHNHFLQSISSDDFRFLAPDLQRVELKQGTVLFDAAAEITHAYFPDAGVISLVVDLTDGETVEAGVIGRDGVIGSSAALNGTISLNRAIVQVAGSGTRIEIRHLREAVRKSETFRMVLYRHDQFILAQAQQSAACLAKHKVEERLCRWLLRTRDLVQSDELLLTQEFISQMLGVRRTSVTMTAKQLSTAGFMTYRRGHIRLQDIDAMKDSACECYQTINAQQARLLGQLKN